MRGYDSFLHKSQDRLLDWFGCCCNQSCKAEGSMSECMRVTGYPALVSVFQKGIDRMLSLQIGVGLLASEKKKEELIFFPRFS